MAKIQVPTPRTRLGVQPATRGTTSTIDIDTKAAGGRAAANLGGAIVGLLAKSAQSQAASRAHTQIAEYQRQKSKEMQQTTNADDALKIMIEAQSGWADEYQRIAEKEGKGLLFREDYDNAMLNGFKKASINFDSNMEKLAVSRYNYFYNAELAGKIDQAKHQASINPGPYDGDTDEFFGSAIKMVRSHALVRGEAATKRDLATLEELSNQLKATAFENDLNRKADAGGIEAAVEWGRSTGKANEYGLKEEDTDRLLDIFEQKARDAKAKVDAAEEIQREAVRTSHSEAIYNTGKLDYEDVFNPASPLTDAEKRGTWKEWQLQLKKIKDGEVVDVPVRDEMSRRYGKYLKNPTAKTRKDAYEYYQAHHDKLPDTQANYTRRGLLEDDPAASDKQKSYLQSMDVLDDMESQFIRVARGGLDDDEFLGTDEYWAIKDETIQDKNEYHRWMQEAADREIILTDEDHRKKTNSLLRPRQQEVVLTGFDKFISAGEPAKTLGKKKVNVLKESGFYEANQTSPEVQREMEARLRAGETLEEVMADVGGRSTDLDVLAARQRIEQGGPATLEEFTGAVSRLKRVDAEAAKEYYDRWVNTW